MTTSGAPEHSTPRKLACALPFYVDNPDANACKVVGEVFVCALGRLCTQVSAHSHICSRSGAVPKKNACVPAAGDCLVGRQLTPRAHTLVRDLDFGGWVSPPLPKAELDHIFLDNHSIVRSGLRCRGGFHRLKLE